MSDKQEPILFYEKEFYVFSNFSSFAIEWEGKLYMTSEHVYHSEKFHDEEMKELIRKTRSAHDALKFAHANEDKYRPDWDDVRMDIMKKILHVKVSQHLKVSQHPYVKKKLLESGGRELIEDSWRDNFWGWGPNKDGANHLGKLWMEVRAEVINNE